MNKHGLVRLSLAAGIAMASFGAASLALAGTPSPQQVPPPQASPPTAPPPVTAPTQAYPLPTPPAAPAQQQLPPSPPQPTRQQLPPPPAQQGQMPASTQQTNAAKFLPGTKSSATYQIPNGTLTVNTGMPRNVQDFGPPPPFKSLDTNHDGRLGETEAQAYPPIDSDFLYASSGGTTISRAQYTKWVNAQH